MGCVDHVGRAARPVEIGHLADRLEHLRPAAVTDLQYHALGFQCARRHSIALLQGLKKAARWRLGLVLRKRKENSPQRRRGRAAAFLILLSLGEDLPLFGIDFSAFYNYQYGPVLERNIACRDTMSAKMMPSYPSSPRPESRGPGAAHSEPRLLVETIEANSHICIQPQEFIEICSVLRRLSLSPPRPRLSGRGDAP